TRERARKRDVALEVLARQRGRPVVVEVGDDLDLCPPGCDPTLPRCELGVRVVAAEAAAAVKADERPVGGQLVALEGPRRVVADRERGAVLSEKRVDVLDEPARLAELEA